METAAVCYLALSEGITCSPFHLLSNIGYFGLISGTFMVISSIERTLSVSLLPSEKSWLHQIKHKTPADFNGTFDDLTLCLLPQRMSIFGGRN